MSARPELLIFRCREGDVAVIERVAGSRNAACVDVKSRAEMIHLAATRRPAGIFLGAGNATIERLTVIPMIRALGKALPIIVVAEEDSFDLERQARQHPIFYYLVHPLDDKEVTAVLHDVLRRAKV